MTIKALAVTLQPGPGGAQAPLHMLHLDADVVTVDAVDTPGTLRTVVRLHPGQMSGAELVEALAAAISEDTTPETDGGTEAT